LTDEDTTLAQGQFVSAIWQVPGFCLATVRPDWMHVCCLGVLQYLCGNVLWELFQFLGGSFRSARTAGSKLENMAQASARSLGIPLSVTNLTVYMFRGGANEKPKMKTKAAQGRKYLPVLLEMLTNYFPHDDDHTNRRLKCVEALKKCYDELDAWVPHESPHRLGLSARQHLMLYRALRDNCPRERLWNMYPKHHILVHLAEGAVANPRLEWNYNDEAEIGAAVKQAQRVHKDHLPQQLMSRYRATFEV